jgi:hypothetical protein
VDAAEWLPYFPELGTTEDLSKLVSLVAGDREVAAMTRSGVPGARFTINTGRARHLVQQYCTEQWPFVWFVLDLAAPRLDSLVHALGSHPMLVADDETLYELLSPALGAMQDQPN